MKNVVMFSTKGKEEGNDKKNNAIKELSRSIATGAKSQSYPIGKHSFVSEKTILFIGCEVNSKGRLSRAVRNILKELSPDEVELVVFYSIAKEGAEFALVEGKGILVPLGVKVYDEEFRCVRGASSKKARFPSVQDLQNAQVFAENAVEAYREAKKA